MRGLSYDIAAVGVLWRREVLRLWQSPRRSLLTLGVTLATWWSLSLGMPFAPRGTIFAGSALLLAVLAASFAAAGVLEDRKDGWLTFVRAGPASAAAIVIGQCAGIATALWMQLLLLLALAPLAGATFAHVGVLAGISLLGAIGLAALGLCVAWIVPNERALAATLALVFGATWLGSGVLFGSGEGLARLMRICDPGAWFVSALSHSLFVPPPGPMLAGTPWLAVGVVAGFATVAVTAAVAAGIRPPISGQSPARDLR